MRRAFKIRAPGNKARELLVDFSHPPSLATLADVALPNCTLQRDLFMPIAFECHCGKHFRVKDSNAGKKLKCPNCNSIIRIPIPASIPAATPPAPPPSVPQQQTAAQRPSPPLPPAVDHDRDEQSLPIAEEIPESIVQAVQPDKKHIDSSRFSKFFKDHKFIAVTGAFWLFMLVCAPVLLFDTSGELTRNYSKVLNFAIFMTLFLAPPALLFNYWHHPNRPIVVKGILLGLLPGVIIGLFTAALLSGTRKGIGRVPEEYVTIHLGLLVGFAALVVTSLKTGTFFSDELRHLFGDFEFGKTDTPTFLFVGFWPTLIIALFALANIRNINAGALVGISTAMIFVSEGFIGGIVMICGLPGIRDVVPMGRDVLLIIQPKRWDLLGKGFGMIAIFNARLVFAVLLGTLIEIGYQMLT